MGSLLPYRAGVRPDLRQNCKLCRWEENLRCLYCWKICSIVSARYSTVLYYTAYGGEIRRKPFEPPTFGQMIELWSNGNPTL